MKTMILVLSPRESRDLLNGNLSVLVRKKFPKDFVGEVYVCVAKNERKKLVSFSHPITGKTSYVTCTPKEYLGNFKTNTLNGKVIARVWCDKVEGFEFCEFSKHKDNRELYNECVEKDNELCKKACISCVQMVQYLDTKAIGKDMFGKAIHITKLEIFDKPKEISEFKQMRADSCGIYYKSLTRAPRSGWCYVEA